MAVTFDSTDATLNLKLSDDLLTATPLASESLSSLWSGIRSNSCASAGKLFFVVNLVKDLSGDGEGARPECFVGLSTRATPVSQLGSGSSWAYASSGQKWAASKAEAFATTFSAGDRIGCFLDLSSQPCTLSFSRNEIWLGHAFDLQQPDRSQKALYPHILLKYMEVTVDFTGDSLVAGNRWPEEASEYMSWMAGLKQDRVSPPIVRKTFTQKDCEVMVMVGLPGSGKSTWAARYVANHPEKHYALLSVDGLIKQLKLASNPARGKQKAPDAKAQQMAEQAYQELLDYIKGVPRNYVLDHSNVYKDSRSAMVSKFRKAGFHTRAAVIVLPDSSLFRRQRKQHQEEGKSVPETTIADMRANFSMPEVGDVFHEVFFVEAKPPEAHDIAAAQAEAAKAALPMLKARRSGGRQTRSRTAKTTPKQTSTATKTDAEEKKTGTGEGLVVANGSDFEAPAASANGLDSTPDKAFNSTAVVAAGSEDAAADSIATDVSEAAPTDHGQTSIGMPSSPKPDVSVTAETLITTREEVNADADQTAEPLSVDANADKAESEPAAASPAGAEEAAQEPVVMTVNTEVVQDPAEPTVSQLETEEIDLDQEAEPSVAELMDEDKPFLKAEQTAPAQEMEQADEETQPTAKEANKAKLAEAQPKVEDSQVAPAGKPMEAVKPEQQVEVPKAESPHKQHSPDEPVGNIDTDMTESEGRGVKRPAPAVVRGAKHARTNQAAGRLLGNIRSQGTVKRTVIRGRLGARPGMRLPPPMSSEAVPAGKPSPDKAKGNDKDKAEAAADGATKAASFKDVMQQLLPAEQDTKGTPDEADPTPQTPQDSSPKQAGKPPARTSSTAKATTVPKREDHVTTKSAGPRSSDRGRQERDRPHSGRQDASRPQQAARSGSRGAAPHPAHGRQGRGTNRYQNRDRAAPRAAPLGPRHAGVQKVRGRPFTQEPSHDRAARHSAGTSAPSRGYAHNGPHSGSRHAAYTPSGGRAGRESPAETQRQAPAWSRNAPPARKGPAPARLPPPVARRGSVPERGPPVTRAPRDDFGGKQRAANARAPERGLGQARAAPAGGFPVGRRTAAPAARQPQAAPHMASRQALPRGRADRPAPAVADRRLSAPPFAAPFNRLEANAPPARGANREAVHHDEAPRYSHAVAPSQRAPRHKAPPERGAGNRPTPAGPRSGNVRVAPPQVFSPPGVSRQQQHPGNFRSPVPAVPPPRLGPLPGARAPGLAGDDSTPRGSRRDPSTHDNRARSRSRGPASAQRGPPYSDRPVTRERQPAAQQLRSATYPQEQPMPQQYHAADPALLHAHAPAHYDQPAGGYAPEPHFARRGAPDRAPVGASRYGPRPVAHGPSQQWQDSPVQAMSMAPASGYQHEHVERDSVGRQGYTGQQRGSDVHMSEARPAEADRRTDRRGRGSRERSDMRRQRIDDRAPLAVDTSRYPSARDHQGHPEQEYAPGLAPDGYMPRDAPAASRSHSYPEDQAYLPPQQHVQSVPPRYDSPMGGYAPPVAQDPHQPVYGSGPVAAQGYTTAAPSVDRQPYYPPQQRPARQAPVQHQQYSNAPQYTKDPIYSSGPAPFAGGSQLDYMDAPPAQVPRGGYTQNAPLSASHHRSEEYDPAYPGSSRAHSYSAQTRPAPNAPVSHGGVSHDAHASRGGVRGGAPSQQWAPSPREPSYGGTPHGSGDFSTQTSQRQGGYSSGPAGWSGSISRAPQEMYPPQQQVGSGRMHAPQGAYGR